MNTDEFLLGRFGSLMSIADVASILGRSPDGVRVALYSDSDMSRRLKPTMLRVGRRVYFRTLQVKLAPRRPDSGLMTDTVIIRRKVRRDFTALSNDLIRDPRLSWGGLGLLVYVLHLPDNFRLRLSHLSKQKASGRDATRARVKELEALRLFGHHTRMWLTWPFCQHIMGNYR